MYLIYVAEGKSKTSHYAIATGFMALGMMLPGMVSGYIQEWLGYNGFFIWVVIAALPAIFLLRFITYPPDFGKKTAKTNE
jgi:PAT family beta-lactamase induction signal transducer AmpG